MNRSIIIVDDDPSMCAMLVSDLKHRRFDPVAFTDGRKAVEHIRAHDVDLVLTDLTLPGFDGLELCRRSLELRPDVPVVAMTAFGSLDTAIGAIRAGAYDFVTKPVDLDILAISLERAAAHRDLTKKISVLQGALDGTQTLDEMIGESEPMKRLFAEINRIADTETSVLLVGESGTGKELLARALHHRSRRNNKPFVAVNCAALPANLLESELFGVRKGAFTDAREDRRGLILEAHGGTLFLDEVADIPLELQPKLLRVLEERQVRPLGGASETDFDVRIVTATNQDLEHAMAEGHFREDLYYRLAVISIHVPPLRHRGTDVLLLARDLIATYAERAGRKITGMSDAVARKLIDYNWPGNVRELRNVIERAVTLTIHDTIGIDDLPHKIVDYDHARLFGKSETTDDLAPLHEIETRYIEHVLDIVGGNRTRAARILGIDRKTLYRKLHTSPSEPVPANPPLAD